MFHSVVGGHDSRMTIAAIRTGTVVALVAAAFTVTAVAAQAATVQSAATHSAVAQGPTAGNLVSSGGVAPLDTSSPTCAKYAANSGSDANPGTAAKPLRTIPKLVASLTAGQTGCLQAGQRFHIGPGEGIVAAGGGTAAKPVVITSARPAAGQQRASVEGWIAIQDKAHDIALAGLDFAGTYTDAEGKPISPKSVEINVLAPRIRITGNRITNPYGICVGAGTLDAYGASYGIRTDDLTVDHNTVYGCGTSPKLTWTDKDSGAHGIYLVYSRGATVVDNLVLGNRYRGFQSWPQGENTLVANNLFDGNATQVNLGSYTESGMATTGTTVRDNIMLGRNKTWYPDKNPGPIVGNFPANSTPTQYGNVVSGNCIAASDGPIAGYGMAVSGTVTATPTFVDRAGGDYRLTSTSACRGKGPDFIQPGAANSATQSVTLGTATCAGGKVTVQLPSRATSSADGEWIMHIAMPVVWDGARWTQRPLSAWSYAWATASGLATQRATTGTSTWLDYQSRAGVTSISLKVPSGAYVAVYQWVYFFGTGTWEQGWTSMGGQSQYCRA